MDPDSEISEAIALLAVSALKGVGYSALYNLMGRGVSPLEVLDTESGEEALTTLRSNGARSDTEQWTRPWPETRRRILERGQHLFENLKTQGVSLVFRENSDYPRQLLDLKDAPHWLFIQGNARVLSSASIAAVGTRTPSPNGVWLARYVGLCLQEWQAPTVSGLALGIDQEIHYSSIEQGLPTIAVLGTGILTDYPKNARSLREEILGCGGALVSEYLPNESYSGQNFVHRNRLQAALCKVLIPVEWAEKSGTAHTVRYAAGLKRPLAGLRVPNMGEGAPLPGGDGNRLFTIPGDEADFRYFVGEALKRQQKAAPQQFTLFGN